MKQEFDRTDRLEKFRDAINAQAKLYCGVDNAYDREKAADFLQQLVKSWRMDADSVITTMTRETQDIVDKQLRQYVIRFLELEQIPFDEAEIKRRWDVLTVEQKNEVVDGIINHMDKYKKQN